MKEILKIYRKGKKTTVYWLENRPIDEFIPLFQKAYDLMVKKKG